ncbi:polysaccharide deacetylase family protein [Vacuolonema iberomarrocanum]|uniref:polysaccharide deacetylase family protein n=1 Tax=Vacuolonema iberomarrocanum TaxID=3454632 RepID=UPI0019E47F3F|nr:polysaccharide deacetylase family protein [filamentous cyanobacterium LEGE 07170]
MELAPLYPLIQPALKAAFPSCLWEGARGQKTIALTFDDGPHPTYTLPLLALLEKHGIAASFFWLGHCVDRAPDIAQKAYAQGHWVGLHGYTHRSFPMLSTEELWHSLTETQAAIARACDLDPLVVAQTIRDVRPPNGLFTPQTLNALQKWQYRPVMWSVVPEDWVHPGIDVVLERIRRQVHDGALIVLHDGAYGGADVVAIAEQLIPTLQANGYRFVTVDQLWQIQSATPWPQWRLR